MLGKWRVQRAWLVLHAMIDSPVHRDSAVACSAREVILKAFSFYINVLITIAFGIILERPCHLFACAGCRQSSAANFSAWQLCASRFSLSTFRTVVFSVYSASP